MARDMCVGAWSLVRLRKSFRAGSVLHTDPNEFAGIAAYTPDCHRAYCSYCQTNFSVAHGGRHDVVKHVGTPTHIRAYERETHR